MSNDPSINIPSDHPEQSGTTQVERRVVNTQGGDYAEGSIDKRQGTFVKGNLVVTEEQAYKVAGLPNPYIGLRAFTAAERDIFAGRKRIVHALVDRLSADDGDRLLFIVGSSGSGKSSLARAGLLPDLADRLRDLGCPVLTRTIDHPGHTPAVALQRALQDSPAPATSPSVPILVLLIDQFEELFSQTDPTQRDQALQLLAEVAQSGERPVRIIATMRSDFLPQLVADTRFEAYERRKVVVRAMTVNELTEAIQRPIQRLHPAKRIEPALLARLAHDAASDAAYLPLLQVTLEDLWRGGDLRLGAYHGLATAIQRRADTVYQYRDHDGLQQAPRAPDEQAAILSLFLDLVRVSLDDEQRDVRWRRPRIEVSRGDPQRERLIGALASARLLRTDQEQWPEYGSERAIETVDIVHEALLSGWSALHDAITSARETLRRRVRFDLALHEWQSRGRSDAYLLTGVRLAEAQDLARDGDSVMQSQDAQALLTRSVQRRDTQRNRVIGGLGLLLVLAVAAMIVAWVQTGVAISAAEQAQNAEATAVVDRDRAD